jgi:hypothetical protein
MSAAAKLRAPAALQSERADPARRTGAFRAGPIDFDRPFVPEEFTQLFYTPLYRSLTAGQRLRYNQLFAIKINEQIMIFEQAFAERMLAPLVGDPRLPREVSDCLTDMVAEEAAHTQLFRELNRASLPEVYARRDACFTSLGPLDRAAFALFTASPRRLPFLLFFSLALEEHSLALALAFEQPISATLGAYEPSFVRAHCEHARDEHRHIHVEAHVIRRLFHRAPRPLRALNAALLRLFLRGILTPRRTGIAVARRWLADRPELAPRTDELLSALRALGADDAFQRSLFSRTITPLTFALFDEDPSFRSLGDVLRGYDRREVPA